MRSRLFGVLLSVLLASAASADVKLSALFGNGMVLQRSAATRVYGQADAGEKVTIALATLAPATVTADPAGRFEATLDLKALPAGPHKLVVQGNNRIEIDDVLIGEVWLCSGQSNMAWALRNTLDSEKAIAAADHPRMRFFTVPAKPSTTPRTEMASAWRACTPQAAATFSAVGYYFGRKVMEDMDTPVGLISAAWGGMPAEAFTSRETLLSDPRTKRSVDNFDAALANQEELQAKYQEAVKAWQAAGSPRDQRPRAPLGPDAPQGAAQLYHGLIYPVAPFSLAGVIWYQGESNAGNAMLYRDLFPMMINDWRKLFRSDELPFLFVQLANFMARADDPNARSPWAELREAQTMTLRLPKTGMAVIIDIGEEKDIHPRNKLDVGKRLALSALKRIYGKDVIDSGPMFSKATFADGKAVVQFTELGGGLVVKGEALKGFAVAGDDKVFHWAQAKVEGDTVVAWSDKVPNPVAVRYGWANNPDVNLYNKADLPASPFRSDDWPPVVAPRP